MVATMGPPRTPPRKRHRSKTSQSPRVSTGSSASSKVARPSALRNPNLAKYKGKEVQEVMDSKVKEVKDVKDSKGKEVKGSKSEGSEGQQSEGSEG